MSEKIPPLSYGEDKNDPAVTEAFIRLSARLVRIAQRFDLGSIVNDAPEDAPFRQDLRWMTEHIEDEDELPGFVEGFARSVDYQATRLDVAVQHVAAMKVLAKRLTQGYEAASSHARAIVTAAAAVHYAIDPSATPEERVTRFAASELAQESFARRMRDALPADPLPFVGDGDDDDDGAEPDHRVELDQGLETCGFTVVWNKRRGFRHAVKHGDYEARIDWNLTAEVKKLGVQGHFAWLLTSGVAHVEPWAVNRFNEGTTDFYATMGLSALCPAFTAFIADLGEYFGADVSRSLGELEAAQGLLLDATRAVHERVIARLLDDDPRRLQHDGARALQYLMETAEANGVGPESGGWPD